MFQFETFFRPPLRLGILLLCAGCSLAAEANQDLDLSYNASVHRGVNAAGGEFGSAMPGTLGKDYTYPTAQEIAEYRKMGFDLVRIPVRWERLAVSPAGALRGEDMDALDKAVRAARSLDMIVVIDLHNYARWSADGNIAQARLINRGAASTESLIAFWTRLARHYGDDSDVWLGIMNEPHDIDVEEWWGIATAVVKGLRSAGVRNKLLVPGAEWTGAHTWIDSGNAEQAARLHDPDQNTVFEVHQYLDPDSSGTSGDCQIGSSGRVDAVIEWAKHAGAALFVGELAAGPGGTCRSEYQLMIAKLERSGLVEGWAAWGGGSWFDPKDPFALPPSVASSHLEHLNPFLIRNEQHAR